MHYPVLMQILNPKGGFVEKTKCQNLGKTLLQINVEEERPIGRMLKKHIDHILSLNTAMVLDDLIVNQAFVKFDFEFQILAICFGELEDVDFFESKNGTCFPMADFEYV